MSAETVAVADKYNYKVTGTLRENGGAMIRNYAHWLRHYIPTNLEKAKKKKLQFKNIYKFVMDLVRVSFLYKNSHL